MTTLPEPPDGTRIEFECGTDVYAAWRDDRSSAHAGYPIGDGGEVWCLYGETVPKTWVQMVEEFGDALALAVRLMPVAEDLPKRDQWPTTVWERQGGCWDGSPHEPHEWRTEPDASRRECPGVPD
jgi:hypothetical protein